VIALLNEQKQTIICRAVTRGPDPSVPLKPSAIPWLGDIPQHWDALPLKAACEIQSGITLGKDYRGQTLREYPYLRVANVQAGHTNLTVVKTIRITKAEAARSMLQQGDVLMTEGGDPDKLGRGCVWDAQVAPCLHQNHIFAVRPKQSQLVPHFLSALMGTSYARAYFQSTAKQTTNLATTNKTKIGQFKVLLPKVDEQNSILTALKEETRPISAAISRLEREIELLREYRTRLVADVVTGKLDVRAAAARLPDEARPEAVEDDADLIDETERADEEAAV
jgi:type I restriction enzyme S subunit